MNKIQNINYGNFRDTPPIETGYPLPLIQETLLIYQDLHNQDKNEWAKVVRRIIDMFGTPYDSIPLVAADRDVPQFSVSTFSNRIIKNKL